MNLAFRKLGDFISTSTIPSRLEKHENASYFWLALLGCFLFKYTKEYPQNDELLMVLATFASFVPLFLYSLRVDDWRLFACIIVTTMIGIVWAPYNAGAAVFVIFSVGMCSRLANHRCAYAALYIVCAILLTADAVFQLPSHFLLPTLLFCLPVGIVSILVEKNIRTNEKLFRKQEEVENLARLAERERISRDIHDVLGHTLSVIALKADLARKLIKTDLAACANELTDIEQSARETLGEVRSTVRNNRANSLELELHLAKKALNAAEVKMIALIEQCTIPLALENVIALSLREAITNIIRHAKATKCKITLSSDSQYIKLMVADDGMATHRDFTIKKGSGLTGMTERIHALQGTLNIHHAHGMTIEISLPIKGAA
ncbi:sensor histidine kinase [Undibacterium sp. Ji49W]|uniref:sensor histidine kinase n=1 Tax=Undibacterium sp. Ji49W TaxID=3413040 RepID=UPI003BF05347